MEEQRQVAEWLEPFAAGDDEDRAGRKVSAARSLVQRPLEPEEPTLESRRDEIGRVLQGLLDPLILHGTVLIQQAMAQPGHGAQARHHDGEKAGQDPTRRA